MNTHLFSKNFHLGIYGVIVKDNFVLLIIKTRGPYTGLLDLPGGKPEFAETPLQTLSREMKEEPGVEVLSAVLWDANSVIVSGWLYHIGIMYRIEIYNQSTYSPLSAQDSGGIFWFDIANGDHNLLTPCARKVVEQLVIETNKIT